MDLSKLVLLYSLPPKRFPALTVGETVAGTLTLDPYIEPYSSYNLYMTLSAGSTTIVSLPVLEAFPDFYAYYSHSANNQLTWDGSVGEYYYEDDGSIYGLRARFLISTPAPAPIPLPASGALLAGAIGAIALVRRRQKVS